MKRNPLPLFLVLAFATTVGDFVFRTWYASTSPEYAVGGVVHPLRAPSSDDSKKHLYLRRSWYLSESPERAWLQVLGHDSVDVWVNGRSVGRSPHVGAGRSAAVLTDISPYIHKGHNVIAIHAAQLILDRPAAVAIDGQLEFPDGSQLSLAQPGDWRATNIYDHRGAFWYETEFDDAHWLKPRVVESENWRTQVDLPPRAVTEPRRSRWINAAEAVDGAATMARSFEVHGKPRDGWLRIIATGPYQIAVNGWLVTDDLFDIAAVAPEHPIERTFDVSAFLKSGKNDVAIRVTTPGEAPRLRADLEATSMDGEHSSVSTDGSWKSVAGNAVNWQSPDFSDAAWQSCRAEIGYLGINPQMVERELGDIHPSIGFWLWRTAADFGLMIICGLAAWIGCVLVGRLLVTGGTADGAMKLLPFVALVPSSAFAVAAALATWDLNWTGHDVYQVRWVVALASLVMAQWLLLLIIAALKSEENEPTIPLTATAKRSRLEIGGIVLCWAILIIVGLWPRVRDLAAEPIHHDEVTCYAFTQGVREYGFPGGQVDPEIPFGWCATSELTYYPTALCSFFVDDPRLVLRIPATIFSMATMALLGYIGWRWFNPFVGFLSAALYAVSPHAIGMADFGRYLAQVQFFTLLTMFLTYEAVRGTGVPPRRLLWGSAISFIAMYLSWEGTGFFGIGLALAVLFQRRRHLRPIFTCPSFYYASAVVGMVVLGQYSHRVMQQTERLWYGEGINSLTVKPMWKFPFFDPTFFLVNSSWIRDALVPMIGILFACVLAARHRWRFPLRFSLICLIVNAELMSLLLPLRTNRYSYHLAAILILIWAAAAVGVVDFLLKQTRSIRLATPYRWYVGAVSTCALLVASLLASGWGPRTAELTDYVTSAYDIRQLRNPDWEGITQYLLAHMGKNDAVVAIFPHEQNFVMAAQQGLEEPAHKVDYWLESKLIVQATLGDSHQIPLDRRSGAKMLYNVEQVSKLFSEYDRVWYCTMRYGHSKINEDIVSQYLREHMDVVYEDFDTALLVRDRNSRPATVRLEEEESGELASDFYLR